MRFQGERDDWQAGGQDVPGSHAWPEPGRGQSPPLVHRRAQQLGSCGSWVCRGKAALLAAVDMGVSTWVVHLLPLTACIDSQGTV